MKSFNFGYKVGMVLGTIFLLSIYFISGWAIVIDLMNRQLPILPLTFLFVVGIWRRILHIEIYLKFNNKNNDDANKIMNSINNKFGGPN